MADVELVELEIIRKFSIATRGATAPVEEVIGALRADLASLTQDPSPQAATEEAEAPTARTEAPAATTRVAKKSPQRSATTKSRTGGRSGGRKRSRVG